MCLLCPLFLWVGLEVAFGLDWIGLDWLTLLFLFCFAGLGSVLRTSSPRINKPVVIHHFLCCRCCHIVFVSFVRRFLLVLRIGTIAATVASIRATITTMNWYSMSLYLGMVHVLVTADVII